MVTVASNGVKMEMKIGKKGLNEMYRVSAMLMVEMVVEMGGKLRGKDDAKTWSTRSYLSSDFHIATDRLGSEKVIPLNWSLQFKYYWNDQMTQLCQPGKQEFGSELPSQWGTMEGLVVSSNVLWGVIWKPLMGSNCLRNWPLPSMNGHLWLGNWREVWIW